MGNGVFCLKYSAMGGLDWYVYAQNAVPWEPQTCVLRLTCSAMGDPDHCVSRKM